MTNRKSPFSRIRLVYRRSSTLLKCVVLAAIVLSTAALITIRAATLQAQADQEYWREQAVAQEQEKVRLEQFIAEQGTTQSIKRIATQELGLVDPDTEFFTPAD